MFRSPYRTYVVVLGVTFVLAALALLAVMTGNRHTCLIETQADPLGGLPASGIPAHCANQFHQHMESSLIAAGSVATLVAPAVAVWRMPGRRRSRPRDAFASTTPVEN